MRQIVDDAIVALDKYRAALEDEKEDLENELEDTDDEDERQVLLNRIDTRQSRIDNATRAIDTLEDIDL